MISSPLSVLVTGATGFVGSALCSALLDRGFNTRGTARALTEKLKDIELIETGPIDGQTSWSAALKGADVVIHLAARVHVLQEASNDPIAEFRCTNTLGTLTLAEQAASMGVKRFIFVSSAKVNGEATTLGRAFSALDTPEPKDPYGISKREAEDGLRQIARQSGMEIVTVRPPLIYGPGVRANFFSMMRWLDKGFPLPFGCVTHNRRSLVALDNLVDLLITCLDHPAAGNHTFMVSDGEDLSTADLLIRMGRAMGKPAKLIPVPPTALEISARLLGRTDLAQRLLGNLQVDMRHTRDILNWSPIISVDEGLRRTATGYTS